MDSQLIIEFGVSFAGVAMLVALSYFLGAWRSAAIDEASARDRLAFDEPDFTPSAILIGADRKAAATRSVDGRELALIFTLGDGLATRRYRSGAVEAQIDGAAVVIQTREPSLRRLRLQAGDAAQAAQWLLAIGLVRVG